MQATASGFTASFRTKSGSDVIEDNSSHVCLRVRLSQAGTCGQAGRMADGPEAEVDEPPSLPFPPLITVSDLPGTTPAGNRSSLRGHLQSCRVAAERLGKVFPPPLRFPGWGWDGIL